MQFVAASGLLVEFIEQLSVFPTPWGTEVDR